jgi:flagellar hook-associated protein 2
MGKNYMGISLNPATLLNGQGFDVTSLVNQILGGKTGQLQEWQQEQSTLQTQASALTSINNDLNSLASAVTALSDPLGALTALAATSSNTGVLTATAQSSATAGVHQIVVNSLATAGTVYTGPFSGGANASFLPTGVNSGEIDLQVGGNAGTTHAIAITAGSNDTLNSLATYINGQNWGVTASVITDANGSRLALTSQSTGTPGALAITSNNTDLNFNAPIGGTNASLNIDGIPYSSASNTISGAIGGVTLNLNSASPGNLIQLTVGPDATRATAAINNFVAAYNQIINDINQQYTLNSSNQEGPLGGDSSLRQLQSSLLADVTYSPVGSGAYVNLASLGINMNNDGTLTVDSNQLNSAFTSNPAAVQDFFQNSSASGFANNFHTDLNNLTDPTQGLLNVDLSQNSAQQKNLTNSINNFEDQLATQQQQLITEFSQVDASLQAYPLLLQQVTETLGTLGGSSSNTGSSGPTLTSGL